MQYTKTHGYHKVMWKTSTGSSSGTMREENVILGCYHRQGRAGHSIMNTARQPSTQNDQKYLRGSVTHTILNDFTIHPGRETKRVQALTLSRPGGPLMRHSPHVGAGVEAGQRKEGQEEKRNRSPLRPENGLKQNHFFCPSFLPKSSKTLEPTLIAYITAGS